MRARLGIIGIIAFVALDVVLVYLAVRHVQATPPSAPSSQEQTEEPTTGEPESPAAPSAQPEPASKEETHLSVAEDSSYIRATSGSCARGMPPVIEISTDGGRTVRPADIPGVTEVLQVRIAASSDLSVVGTNRACQAGRYVSQDGGDRWTRSDGAGSLWYMARNQSVPRVVHAPRRLVKTPCEPQSLSAPAKDVLRILCVDGQVIGSADEGSSWVTLGTLPRAVAIWFTSPGEGYAVAGRPACAAAVLETVNGGSAWDQRTCLGEGQPQAIAASGDVIAALVSGTLHLSTDGGNSWDVP